MIHGARKKIEPRDGDDKLTLVRKNGNWLWAKAVGGTMVAGLGWWVPLVGRWVRIKGVCVYGRLGPPSPLPTPLYKNNV